MWIRLGDKILLCAIILLLAAEFGFSYGIDNQNTYLIKGLTRIHPGLLKHDWFASSTIHYHSSFVMITVLAAMTGYIGWTMALLNWILIATAFWSVYRLFVLLLPTHGKTGFYLLAGFVLLDRTWSAGGSFIHHAIFQPSSLAATLTLVAILFFVQARYLLSGIALALAGFFHTNFLLLGFPYWGVAHLLLGRDRFFPRILQQHGLSLILLIVQLPFLIKMGHGLNVELSRHIFLVIRSPHHYLPLTYLREFLPLMGWGMLGLVSIGRIQIEDGLHRRFWALYFSFLFLLLGATLLTTAVFVPFVSQLYFWRMAPFFVVLAQVSFITYCITAWGVKEATEKRISVLDVMALLFGFLLIAWYNMSAFKILHYRTLLTFGGLLLLMIGPILEWRQRSTFVGVRSAWIGGLALAWLAILFPLSYGSFIQHSSLLNGSPGEQEKALYAWGRQSPLDSIFLISPDMEDFRLQTERAVVVDWKSTPIDPDGLIEWYRRVGDVAGNHQVKSLEEAVKGYAGITQKRILELQQKYQANFVVVYRKNTTNIPLPIAFENEKFIIYRL